MTPAQIAAAKAKADAKAAARKGTEGAAKEWLKVLDVDELVIVLKGVFDLEYMTGLWKALTPQPRPPANAMERRV